MKALSFVFLCVALLTAGCESVSSRMEERFSGVAPHTRIFPASQKAVYNAALQAVKNSGLLLGRKSMGEGRIQGYAPIRSGDATQDARQTTIEVRLFETDAADTRVELLVWEHTEGGFPGGVSERALAEHGLYGDYFAALEQVLAANGDLKVDAKH
jgi:hypothetical protein